MIYVESPFINPYKNLALEEHLLTSTDCEVFMLWRNGSAVIVGKNQNTLSEINSEYIENNNIKVVRRLTGGGAVFHDLGNLNFSFMVKNERGYYSDFAKFTEPIISALKSYGLNAEFGGRNDILLGGKKISGNAQAVKGDRLLHHGTLLFHTDFSQLAGALNPNPLKIQSKSIQSTRARVANICEHKQIEIEDFISRVKTGERYNLTNADFEEVSRLSREKYGTWEWNYGNSPKYSYHNEKRFDGGCLEVYVDVKNGIIENVKFYGDFFARKDVSEIENALKGEKHKRSDVAALLGKFNLSEYFLNITAEEVADVIAEL